VVKVGDEIEVKILRVDVADRKVGLSRKQLNEPLTPETTEGATTETAAPAAKPRERELRGGTGSGGGQLINMPAATPAAEAEQPATEGATAGEKA